MINPDLFRRYAESLAAFRENLNVDCDGSVRRFGDVMDDWQRKDFRRIDRGLKQSNGRSQFSDEVYSRIYLERPRGHSKTTDLAVIVVWALAFSARPIRGFAFAVDRDQAKLLSNAVDVIIRLNPWLGEILEVQRDRIINIAKGHPGEGATLNISTSDVGSSYGILPDLIIADELTHWMPAGEQLWQSLISSAAKRATCLFVIISNAGFADSWQWNVREAARTDEDWYFSRLDGPQASWITQATLDEQARLLPGLAFNRLWLNEWSSAGGDALSEEVIEQAFKDSLQPLQHRQDGWKYVAGVDLGLTRDCAAVVVLGVPDGGKGGKIRLVHNRLWVPPRGGKIDLLDVEKHILGLDEAFGLEFVAYDPWQAEHLSQTIESDSGHRRRNQRRSFHAEPFMREIPPSATNLRAQASLTIEFFNDNRIELYDCPPLKRDLKVLRVVEKSYGIRLTSPRDGTGHGDTFSAFALALLVAHEIAGKQSSIVGGGFYTPATAAELFLLRQQEYEQEQAEVAAMEDNSFLDALRAGSVSFSPTFPDRL